MYIPRALADYARSDESCPVIYIGVDAKTN